MLHIVGRQTVTYHLMMLQCNSPENLNKDFRVIYFSLCKRFTKRTNVAGKPLAVSGFARRLSSSYIGRDNNIIIYPRPLCLGITRPRLQHIHKYNILINTNIMRYYISDWPAAGEWPLLAEPAGHVYAGGVYQMPEASGTDWLEVNNTCHLT